MIGKSCRAGVVLALICFLARSDAYPQISLDAPAPELVGGPWLNTPKKKPVRLASRKGKVTILHFWTYG